MKVSSPIFLPAPPTCPSPPTWKIQSKHTLIHFYHQLHTKVLALLGLVLSLMGSVMSAPAEFNSSVLARILAAGTLSLDQSLLGNLSFDHDTSDHAAYKRAILATRYIGTSLEDYQAHPDNIYFQIPDNVMIARDGSGPNAGRGGRQNPNVGGQQLQVLFTARQIWEAMAVSISSFPPLPASFRPPLCFMSLPFPTLLCLSFLPHHFNVYLLLIIFGHTDRLWSFDQGPVCSTLCWNSNATPGCPLCSSSLAPICRKVSPIALFPGGGTNF